MLGGYHFLPGGWAVCLWGDQNSLGGLRGDQFFSPVGKGRDQNILRMQRGHQNLFMYAKGGPEKNGDRPSQTEFLPPGKK